MIDGRKAELFRLINEAGHSIRGAAKVLGINPSTALNWAMKARERGTPVARTSDTPEGKLRTLDRRNARLEQELAELRKRARTESQSEALAERIREQIFSLAGARSDPPEWLIDAPSGGSAPGVPVTIWSDWHWGELVRAAEVGGVNAYSAKIARGRAQHLVVSTISLCFDHMVKPEYPGVVICLGGDMVSGDIHEELAQTNEVSMMQQVIELAGILEWGLRQMAARFGKVFVPCVVGNHGRNTRKPRMKGRAFTNFDWLLYCLLERNLKDDPRIQFLVPEGADALFAIYGHRFALTHGDALGVRGGDGIIGALGPIMRGRIKMANSEAQIGRDFDTLLMGHWHQYITLPGLVVNGSLKGYDEFARLGLRAPYQRPTQALFFVHPKHGVTCHWPVFLEAKQKQDAPWLTWRAA